MTEQPLAGTVPSAGLKPFWASASAGSLNKHKACPRPWKAKCHWLGPGTCSFTPTPLVLICRQIVAVIIIHTPLSLIPLLFPGHFARPPPPPSQFSFSIQCHHVPDTSMDSFLPFH